jgi:hypothetical protein
MKTQILLVISLLATGLAIKLDTNQKNRLENIAWLYAQFSLTFNGNELPLDTYYASMTSESIRHFAIFEEIQDFFSGEQLKVLFAGVDMSEFGNAFTERIHFYQKQIILEDKVPLSLEMFYDLFQQVSRRVEETTIQMTFSDSTFKNAFCPKRMVRDNKVIVEALENFKIRNLIALVVPTKESNPFTLSDDHKLMLKGGNTDIKDKDWAAHHIIPSKTLKDFYKVYYGLLNKKSELIETKSEYNWIKIVEINSQKSLLVQAKNLWAFSSKNAVLPVLGSKGQNNFIQTQFRWPKGLIMYGPKIRSDDPDDKLEEKVKHVVGTDYYLKVKALNDELLEFIKISKNQLSIQDLEFKAKNLYIQLNNIHNYYDNGNPCYIFPFNSDQWSFENGFWFINTGYDADNIVFDFKKNQWKLRTDQYLEDIKGAQGIALQKQLAQQEFAARRFLDETIESPDMVDLITIETNDVNLPLTLNNDYSHLYGHDEHKRRKRFPVIDDPMDYLSKATAKCKIEETTTIRFIPIDELLKQHRPPPQREETNCGYYLKSAPSLISVPIYGLCKLFG